MSFEFKPGDGPETTAGKKIHTLLFASTCERFLSLQGAKKIHVGKYYAINLRSEKISVIINY